MRESRADRRLGAPPLFLASAQGRESGEHRQRLDNASASPTTPQGPNRYVIDIVWIKERARAGAQTNEATVASFGEAMQCSLDTNSPYKSVANLGCEINQSPTQQTKVLCGLY